MRRNIDICHISSRIQRHLSLLWANNNFGGVPCEPRPTPQCGFHKCLRGFPSLYSSPLRQSHIVAVGLIDHTCRVYHHGGYIEQTWSVCFVLHSCSQVAPHSLKVDQMVHPCPLVLGLQHYFSKDESLGRGWDSVRVTSSHWDCSQGAISSFRSHVS